LPRWVAGTLRAIRPSLVRWQGCFGSRVADQDCQHFVRQIPRPLVKLAELFPPVRGGEIRLQFAVELFLLRASAFKSYRKANATLPG
jgi:hypothetical protein